MKPKQNSKKQLNSTYKGYVLYDSDLNEKYFIDSMNEILGLHDVFSVMIKDRKLVKEDITYNFDKIHAFDQVSFVSDVNTFINKQQLKKPAEFKLIYFHNNLRGFFFRFNRVLFDESSIKKFIQALEKQYFKGKYKQMGSSILKDEDNFYIPKAGQYASRHKIISFDEQLTKRIRNHIKKEEITLYQFMSGIIGAYFKISKRKDINFEGNVFETASSVIGKQSIKQSYGFKKNPKASLNKFIKNDYIELNKFAKVRIDAQDRYGDLKGNVFMLPSDEILNEIEFKILEKDWEIEIHIDYQMMSYKKDDMFLMLNKLRMLTFEALENGDQALTNVSLLTKKEEEMALKYVEAKYRTDLKSPYQLFALHASKNGAQNAIVDDKSYTYEKLSTAVSKYRKALKKASEGEVMNLNVTSLFDKCALFLAADAENLVVNEKTGRNLKKGLFGYKLVGDKQASKLIYQYEKSGNSFTKEAYRNYTSWFKGYFNLRTEDLVHAGDDILTLAIPALVNGTTITSSKDKATMGIITSDEVKASHLKHIIVFDRYVSGGKDQKVYYAKSWHETLPIAMIGPIIKNRVQLEPVKGLGILVLNKVDGLTQAFEKGNVFIHGPLVAHNKLDQVSVGNHDLKGAKLKQQGTWFLDGTLRL